MVTTEHSGVSWQDFPQLSCPGPLPALTRPLPCCWGKATCDLGKNSSSVFLPSSQPSAYHIHTLGEGLQERSRGWYKLVLWLRNLGILNNHASQHAASHSKLGKRWASFIFPCQRQILPLPTTLPGMKAALGFFFPKRACHLLKFNLFIFFVSLALSLVGKHL